MTIAQLTRRLRGAWNHLAAIRDRIILKMALPALEALVATASAAADRLVTQAQSDAAALADANAQIANFETDAVAAVQPLADKLQAAAPELVPADGQSGDPVTGV